MSSLEGISDEFIIPMQQMLTYLEFLKALFNDFVPTTERLADETEIQFKIMCVELFCEKHPLIKKLIKLPTDTKYGYFIRSNC